ncbi:transporter substrate-binding domain-containing protein [Archangium primigenium]|uniref:transporter substrate-binding domain-containing protein n=1 Tax=[Archangium] primigenium TaxID=2792470 RepID=UPI00195EE5BD|nr:transporter substrate-binding domain-containing protein [Archangium primigenium]MBM7116549.1 transporter substrate-binding domain-containing protein [Archangium primigenium]
MAPCVLRVRAVLVGAVLALAAACTTPSATAPAAREAPVLRVGTSGDYPPFTSMREDGRVSGFDAALLDAYAAERGYRLEWVRFHWPGLVADLTAHRFDLAASGLTLRPERSLVGRYTVPVARNGALVLLRRPAWAPAPTGPEAPLATLQALDRPEFRLAVNLGGHLERVARAHFRHARILAIPGNAVREALVSGQADALLTNTVEGPRWAEGLTGLERVGPFTQDTVALYVEASRAELAADLDTWLLAQEASGALARWRERYLGEGAREATATPVDALLVATAERLALMPRVAEAKRRAGVPLEVPEQEARVLEAARRDVHQAARDLGLPAPSDAAITAFFQAQMDAAKQVQARAPRTDGPADSLEDLRAALARISARIATLVPRVPGGLAPDALRRQTRAQLAASGLTPGECDRLAEALAALGPAR